jgi:hypothetical protein
VGFISWLIAIFSGPTSYGCRFPLFSWPLLNRR